MSIFWFIVRTFFFFFFNAYRKFLSTALGLHVGSFEFILAFKNIYDLTLI